MLTLVGETASAASEFAKRSLYREAVERLQRGQIAQFNSLAAQLADYSLKPYLDYHLARHELSQGQLTTSAFLKFKEAHAELPATHLLHKRWLKSLGAKRQWRTLRKHYFETTDAELRCFYLRALYGTGEKDLALQQTGELWVQPRSQPKACDPLFDVYRSSSYFSEDVAWTRLVSAIRANERQLARYLVRYLSGSNALLAETLVAVHANPTRIKNTQNFPTNTERRRMVVLHGLTRLASKAPQEAQLAWENFAQGQFSAAERQVISSAIATSHAKLDNQFPDYTARPAIDAEVGELALNLADAGILHQNWTEAAYWIERLNDHERQKSKWQYWHARSLLEQMGTSERAQLALQSLATKRHYYGFLAAQQLGINASMNERSGDVAPFAITQLRRNGYIERSIELFAVGDEINGRREWFRALETMPKNKQLTAAVLAQQLGLVSLAISTANIADATDHLDLRFPIAYLQHFRQASHKTGLSVASLIAIARQESAMNAEARSHANARGLMQLLPGTARLVAQRARVKNPPTASLYQPTVNIELGSYHLAWLLERYGGQSPLAIAAYNAGEHRVDRWVKDNAGTAMDVWIESIPFRETRNYVKNVLAFKHVYATLLNRPEPLLNPGEQIVSN
jgi:soluble lytic murein transglycosylase